MEVGSWLLTLVRQIDPGVTPAGLLRLEFQSEESQEMPLVWIVAHNLLYIWEIRSNGKKVNIIETRAKLEFKISLLRETRFRNQYEIIKELFEKHQ